MSRMPSSFDGASPDVRELNFIEKVKFNCKQQPLIPLGTLATTIAVILAAHSIRVGNRRDAQKWFRYRVGFQGFTIAALVIGGFIYGKDNVEKKKSREEALHEKAKLREKLWIEELERRDRETKLRKKRAELARQKMKEMEENESSEVKNLITAVDPSAAKAKESSTSSQESK